MGDSSYGGCDVWMLATQPCAPLHIPTILSTDEWTLANRFGQAADRVAFIAGRAITRGVLATIVACGPLDIRFDHDTHDRPRAVWPEALRSYDFNISHSSGLVGVAVSRWGAVGLDIESADRHIDPLSLQDAVLAPAEIAALARQAEAMVKRDYFLRLWTLKEAYLKARGLGLTADFHAVAFDLDHDSIRLMQPNDDDKHWTFHQRRWPTEHIVAVCHTASAETVNFIDLSTIQIKSVK